MRSTLPAGSSRKLLILWDMCKDGFGTTPLMTAARNGDLDAVRRLIARGDDPLAVNYEGFNSLHAAAMGGRPEVAQYLIGLGIQVECRSSRGYTPLNIAAVRAPLELIAGAISPFLAAGADINTRAKHENTPLIAAAVRNATDAVAYLVSHGANIDARDAAGMTALMLVARIGRYPAMARHLIRLGANPATKNHAGRTAWDIASDSMRGGIIFKSLPPNS